MRPCRLALAALLFATAAGAGEPLPAPGQKAPLFRLKAYNPKAAGEWVGLDRFVGPSPADKGTKLLLLSFMASYCAPCKKELPALQRLHQAYAEKGLRVVLVSLDDQPEGMKIIEDLIAEHQVTFPVLKDRSTLAARRWLGKDGLLPSVFLVRADATVAAVSRGYDADTSAQLEGQVRAQLGLPP